MAKISAVAAFMFGTMSGGVLCPACGIMKVLVCLNKFSLGGRETYLQSYLRELKSLGFSFALMAGCVDEGSPGLDEFASVEVLGGIPGENGAEWIGRGGEFISRYQPQVIWAHHYDLLPAWILSRLYRLPLLATFHGPLLGEKDANRWMEAAGMVLALSRGDVSSAVSLECQQTLDQLLPGSGPHVLLPNAIPFPASFPDSFSWHLPPQGMEKFVCLARFSKLGHVRAAVRMFHDYRLRHGRGTLTLFGASECHEQSSPGNYAALLRLLGRRWCWQQGPGFLLHLRKVRLAGIAVAAAAEIPKYDAVFGMGRVVLEGMAAGRPAILTGYQEVHGLVTRRQFESMRFSNFSGRGVPAPPMNQVVDTIRLPSLEELPTSAQLAEVSLAHWVGRAGALLKKTAASRVTADPLAEKLCDLMSESGTSATDNILPPLNEAFSSEESDAWFRLASPREGRAG